VVSGYSDGADSDRKPLGATRNREEVKHVYPNLWVLTLLRSFAKKSRAHRERPIRRCSSHKITSSVEKMAHGHTRRCSLSPDEQLPEDTVTTHWQNSIVVLTVTQRQSGRVLFEIH
jgi:hypothetical protein